MKKKPILITGATGFLGRYLLNALSDSDDPGQPLALVRSAKDWLTYDWTRDLKKVEVIEGSVTHPESWINDPRLEGLSGIYHLAAVVRHSRKNPSDMYHTNVEGTLNMVRLAASHRCRILFVSTSGTVGCFREKEEWADETSPYCEGAVHSWPYYDSKVQAEKKARKLSEELGVALVIIRPPALLGPGDHRARTTAVIRRFLKGKLPFLVRGGINFVDIRDAARAIVKAMSLPNPRSVYHLAGTSLTIDEFFKMLQEVSGVKAPRFYLPGFFACLLAKVFSWSGLLPDPVIFEMASKYWNIRSRYGQELGFISRDPYQTLADTVHWLLRS